MIKDYQRQVFKVGIKRLNIDQQFAEIGLRTVPARLRISSGKGQLTIKNVRPQMRIDRKPPTFKVNRKKLNSDMGLKPSGELSKNFRDKGKQKALQGVRQNKDDGNSLANHKISGDRVQKLAASKAKARLGPKEFNIGLIPENSPPEVNWDKGYMRINWSRHNVIIDFSGDFMPDMSVDPKHSVEVFIRKAPYLRVMVEESVNSAGKYINSAV